VEVLTRDRSRVDGGGASGYIHIVRQAAVLGLITVLTAAPVRADDFQLIPVRPIEILRPGDAAPTRISEPVFVPVGTRIDTTNGAAELRMPDGSKLLLAPYTKMDVPEFNPKGSTFNLLAGHLRAAIAGLFSSRMKITTPTAVAAVRGTEFDIHVSGERVLFEVADGALEVSNQASHQSIMVTSEESLIVDRINGMGTPTLFGLHDDRSQPAARPFVVFNELGRDGVKENFEDNRTRDQKAGESQLGKFAIDVHGNRVRMEEYLLRPDPSSFKFLFLSHRPDQGTLDWGTFTETFANPLPADLSQVPKIVAGTFMNPNSPSNWLASAELFLTNTVDIYDQKTTIGAPAFINFAGVPGLQPIPLSELPFYRYFPSSIVTETFLGGPGVAAVAGPPPQLSSNGLWLVDKRQLDNTTVPGSLTFTRWVLDTNHDLVGTDVNPVNDPTMLLQGTVNPALANPFDPAAYAPYTTERGCYFNQFCGRIATVAPTGQIIYPNGPDSADTLLVTTYADGTSLTERTSLVNNDGSVVGGALPAGNPPVGDFNLEFSVGSNIFKGNGGKIDVLISPQIFGQFPDVPTIKQPGPPLIAPPS
jgi:hypothetical protein